MKIQNEIDIDSKKKLIDKNELLNRLMEQLTAENNQLKNELKETKNRLITNRNIGRILDEEFNSHLNPYYRLFYDGPIATWVIDYHKLKSYLNSLDLEKEANFENYLDTHPFIMDNCINRLKIIALNKASLDLFNVQDIDTLNKNIPYLFSASAKRGFKNVILSMLDGKKSVKFGYEIVVEKNYKLFLMSNWLISHVDVKQPSIVAFFIDLTEKKRTRDKYLQVEQKFRNIVETTHGLIFQCDINGNFTYLSPAWEEILGYTLKEMIGRKFTEFKPPKLAKHIIQFEKTTQGSITRNFESSYITKDGERLDFIFNSVPLYSNRGEIIGTQGIAYDISDRKKTEVKLIRSKKRNRAILTSSLDSKIIFDHRGKILDFNLSAENLFHYSREEVLGQINVDSIIPLIYKQFNIDQLNPLNKSNKPIIGQRLNLIAVQSNGTEFPIEMSLQMLDEDDTPIFVLTVRDLSEVKKIKNKIKESLNRYEILFNSAPIGILLYRDGKILFVNPHLLRMFQYKEEEMKGLNFVKLLHEKGKIKYKKRDLIRKRGLPQPESYNTKGLRNDGEEILIHVDESVTRLIDGKATLSFIQDISEKKRVEFEIKQIREQLYQSQKMEAIGRLAGSIAHDFNNMLMVIIGNSDLLLNEMLPNNPNYSSVLNIYNAAKSGSEITQQLLSFSRKRILRPIVININEVVQTIEEMMINLFPSNINLIIDLDENLKNVHANKSQMENALMNLVVNAQDALVDGGDIITHFMRFFLQTQVST